ncbi:hypothetical protein GCM10020218_007570 [Dactylosporangium vinaceum]
MVRASPSLWTLPFGLSTLGRGGAGGQSYDYPVMMAGSILTIVPVAAVFIVFQRFFVRGVAASASRAERAAAAAGPAHAPPRRPAASR